MHFDTFHCMCDAYKCAHHRGGDTAVDFGPPSGDSVALKNSLMSPMFGGHCTADPLSFPTCHPFYKAATFQYGKRRHKEFTDVRQMESTLYQLLTDFHLGKLHAFGEGVTFENMIKVREQQENLARLHFELNFQQSNKQSFETDTFFNDPPGQSNAMPIMSKPFSKSNMLKLIQNLQNLCKSIERLQWKNANELEF